MKIDSYSNGYVCWACADRVGWVYVGPPQTTQHIGKCCLCGKQKPIVRVFKFRDNSQIEKVEK